MTIQMEHNCYKYSCVPSFLLVRRLSSKLYQFIVHNPFLFTHLHINAAEAVRKSGGLASKFVSPGFDGVVDMMNFLKKYFLPLDYLCIRLYNYSNS